VKGKNIDKIKRKIVFNKADNTRRERKAIRDSKCDYYEEKNNEETN
jgi:hypothetical protein